MDNISEIIKKIRVIEFRYNNKVTTDKRKRFGCIAQELAEIFDPEIYSIVTMEDDGYYCVDYVQLVPLLIKHIQTLETRIEKLENKEIDNECNRSI